MVPVSLDPQIIKRSIAYRAKHRAEQGPTPTYRISAPLLVVPHPKNRGGVPVTSLRTKELVGAIVKESCDVDEANSSAVAVEEQPHEKSCRVHDKGGNPLWPNFQAEFEKKSVNDDCLAKVGKGSRAVLGSLSHSHFNCCNRNILCGKHGCECPITRGDGDEKKIGNASVRLPRSWIKMGITHWTNCRSTTNLGTSCATLASNGEVVLLKMHVTPKAKAKSKVTGRTWVDAINASEKKRLKTSENKS